MTAAFGVMLAPAIADAAAAAAAGLATSSRMATGLAGSVVGSTVAHILPGGAWDAAKKDHLWRAYETDYHRRGLA